MTLKEQIKNIIKNKKSDFKTLDLITKKKLKAITDNSSGLYNDLSKIEHSLYRYNTLLNSNLLKDAEKEGVHLMNLAENSDSVDITLTGGISNTKYVWQTEPNACEECKALDGTEYETKEDVPEKPHPNCKCKVVEIKDEDDEECPCSDFFEELDSEANEIEIAKQYLDEVNSFVKDALNFSMSNELLALGFSVMQEIDIAMNAYHDFQKSKAEMIAYKGYDKYHHARANCEATQRGLTGEIMAYTLSYGKEVYDIIKKVIFEGMEFEKAWNDSMQDLEADKYGMQQGRRGENCSESVKNVGDIINKLR